MAWTRTLRSLLFAAAALSIAACSAAPESTSSDDQAVAKRPAPTTAKCQVTALTGGPPAELAKVGCTGLGLYEYWSYANELYTTCPLTPAVQKAIAQWNVVNPDDDMHEAPKAHDSCLPVAPLGHVYVFWDKQELHGPTCPGGCPEPGGGW